MLLAIKADSDDRRVLGYPTSLWDALVPAPTSAGQLSTPGPFRNTTDSSLAAQSLLSELESLFRMAAGESFEDGMETEFSRSLMAWLDRHQECGLAALTKVVASEGANPAALAEALRWVGRSECGATPSMRLKLLETGLRSPSPQVRDGAALGMAALDDPAAIPALEMAARAEKIGSLRDDLMQVLEQLQETAGCHPY